MANSISLTLDNPAFRIEKAEHGMHYILHFDGDDAKVAVQLSLPILDVLLRQGEALVPRPEERLPTPEVDRTWRESAWLLRELDDRSWQLLLREVSSDALVLVLWYLKDRDIASAAMRNCSQRLAAMLTEDLIARYGGRNPDDAKESTVQMARKALAEILAILYRLVDEGQVEAKMRLMLNEAKARFDDLAETLENEGNAQ